MIRRNFLAGLMATVASAFIIAGAEAVEPVVQTIKESRSIHAVLLSLPQKHPGITKIKLSTMRPDLSETNGVARYGAIMDRPEFFDSGNHWAQRLSDSTHLTQNGMPERFRQPGDTFSGAHCTSWEIEVTENSEQMFRYYGTSFERAF